MTQDEIAVLIGASRKTVVRRLARDPRRGAPAGRAPRRRPRTRRDGRRNARLFRGCGWSATRSASWAAGSAGRSPRTWRGARAAACAPTGSRRMRNMSSRRCPLRRRIGRPHLCRRCRGAIGCGGPGPAGGTRLGAGAAAAFALILALRPGGPPRTDVAARRRREGRRRHRRAGARAQRLDRLGADVVRGRRSLQTPGFVHAAIARSRGHRRHAERWTFVPGRARIDPLRQPRPGTAGVPDHRSGRGDGVRAARRRPPAVTSAAAGRWRARGDTRLRPPRPRRLTGPQLRKMKYAAPSRQQLAHR